MASQPSRPSFDAVQAFKAMAVDPDDIVTKDYPNSEELRDMAKLVWKWANEPDIKGALRLNYKYKGTSSSNKNINVVRDTFIQYVCFSPSFFK